MTGCYSQRLGRPENAGKWHPGAEPDFESLADHINVLFVHILVTAGLSEQQGGRMVTHTLLILSLLVYNSLVTSMTYS